MADALPVCDVLCEATEYLSKLGSNLKFRTDNLREKKIRKNLLKNTHAVQKAASKVLSICELSKKSLENVETTVNHLLSQIAASQSAGTKVSRSLSDSKEPFEYFVYASKQLKIKNKISLAHYTSVKVVVKAMPSSMLKKFPVHIDCKLFRQNKKRINRKKLTEDANNTKSDNGSKSVSEKISKSNDTDSLSVKPSNVYDENIPEGDLKHKPESDVDDNKNTKATNKTSTSSDQIDNLDKSSPKSTNNVSENVETSTDMCEEKQCSDIINKESVNSVDENKKTKTERKKRKYSRIISDSSDNEDEEDNKKLEKNISNMKINDTSTICLDSSLEVSCINNESTKEKNADVKNSDTAANGKLSTDNSSESAESTKKVFLKCININKLLKPPKEDDCIIINDDEEDDIVLKDLKKRKNECKIKNKPKRKFVSNQDLADKRYKEQKEKVKSFKPKEFSINLQRLPKFSLEFLETYKLRKITKGKSIIFAIESCSEKTIEECNSEERTNVQLSELGKSKNSTGHSDCDITENNEYDKDLLEVTENVKKALLDDSDSDTNNFLENTFGPDKEFSNNEDNSVSQTKETIESLDKQQIVSEKIAENNSETNNDNQAQCDENLGPSKSPSQQSPTEDFFESNKDLPQNNKDLEFVKSSLLNNSSDEDTGNMNAIENSDNPLSDNILNNSPTSKKNMDNQDKNSSLESCEMPEQVKSPLSNKSNCSNNKKCVSPVDQEIIKSSLLNDSSNDSSTSQKRDRNNEDASPHNDVGRIKSLLLDDSSCASSTSHKSEGSHGKNKSPHPSDDHDNIKSSLLDDSLHSDPTTSQKQSSHKEDNIDVEQIKSSLLKDSDDSSSSQKIKKDNERSPKQLDKEQELIKSSLLNDCSDCSPLKSQKDKDSEKETPPKLRKRIMENMRAKKMLLTYSSSSDTEDEQLRNALKEIKDSLLKEISDDKSKHRTEHHSESSSDKDMNLSLRKRNRKRKKKNLDTEDKTKSRKKIKIKPSNSSDDENSNSSFRKMGGTRTKLGSSSSQYSDGQDINDKVVDRLTNLKSLHKSRRRSSSEESAGSGKPSSTDKDEMPKVPRIATESLLKAESSSDATSLAGSEEVLEEEVEELPAVTMSALNGDGVHLAKADLLEDSDSSSSHNKSQEDEKNLEAIDDQTEDEKLKSRRRKALAISSDSEAGSSRRRDRDRGRDKLSDFEDSEDDGSEPQGKKKRKKKPADSDDNSSVESGKKKRRRIKNVDDTDDSDSDTENEGRNKHGRKNIRKVMGKNQLEEATKKAAREEKERIARIAERQKLYNNMEFDESGKPDEVKLEKVVLDFDPETKEPLIEVDRGLVKKLKPHQANGIKFMWDACFESVKRIKKNKGSGCILAHCMGLGKTLQVVSLTHTLLTHNDLTGVNRVLVVCPLSTVLNWVNEFRMWLKHAERESEVDVYELSRHKQNSERAYQLQQWYESGGVCVLGYEMFRNLSADNSKKFKKKMLKTFQESLVDPGPDMVVCDEGHLLKNEKTSLSQSINRVKTLRRIVLTGTPLQNNLKEYYCMVQFVKPNLLGKYNEYLNRFVNPITNGQYTDSTEHDIRIMKRRSHVLHKMLDGAVQRRDYGVLAPFLPPKHEYVLFITLSEVQIKLYQHYLDNYSRRPLPGKSSGFLFPDFQSLQRIWTHPLVLKYNSERYEIMQQKKREREEEEDSEGSLADFIDDESTPDESSTAESSEEYSDGSDDSHKKNKKKKAAKKGKSKVTTRRGTRANPTEQLEEDEKSVEMLEEKNENPTEWWVKLVSDDELEDMRNSHKLVLLFDILRQCEAIGDKLLVFSQSLYSLDLIEHFLAKVDEATQEGRIDEKLGGHVGSWSPGIDYFRLDGSISCENRSIWCKNFNREDNPRARLFLISTRAGGLGINLVAANRVVIFDVSWNPSHDVQSIFRVYRFGQKKPCYVYRFLAMGTMEEKIYERQVTKQAISKRVIDEQQIDRHYAENDLAELYKFLPRPPAPRPLPPLPKDRLFAELLREHDAQIYKYHEHDSLLENKEEETLSEEERKAAWEDFENEKNRPPPAPFPAAWPMPNGMMPGLLAQQQQQLAYAALDAMLRKDNVSESRIQELLPLIYNTNPGLMQKMSELYKYAPPGMMNSGMMNPVMNPGGGAGGAGAAGAGALGGSSGLQYEPPWLRQQKQQQMRLQQMVQQQQGMGAKYYAGGLGSRDPVAMALQQQRAREIMLGERGRPRGRPPLARPPPTTDVVNLADSD
ncbi:PREDICTED: transcriptional regulator ATRX homolog isoform X1 [Papilio xuthus]|uniref:DNA helicase n=2 Tax=Papilio xuthus TaxID=66420 RepID=A0AAJ6ZI23_PAPXU|nr:PREDICTED: transcriptional regulator ATRX homolog isoform X1 [Papilio xuthus]